MDEEMREEIMPMELAIQRELAYRHKIAMFNIQSTNHSAFQFMPLQVHSSPSVAPGPTLCSSLDSHVAKNQKDIFFCKVCQVSCSSAISYKQHIRGHKHKAILRILPFKGNDDAGITAVNSRKRCGLCNVWCMNESSFNQHLEGQKHKGKLQKLELAGNNTRNMVKKQRFW
ncbi:hypothetical protein REPUB_Repub07fG0053100 [Reevesia pubescens]